MLFVENNENLWKDEQSFKLFKTAVSLLSQEISGDSTNIDQVTRLADGLDQLFQTYEDKYDEMEDPLFYWWFAFSNAILVVSDVDSTRNNYAVNGFKTSLSRHVRVPSFSQEMIDLAYNFIDKIEPGNDGRGWIENNKHMIKPI